MGYAPPPHAEYLAGTGSWRNSQFLNAIEGREIQVGPEGRLGNGKVQAVHQVVAVPFESRMRAYPEVYIEVSGRTTPPSDRPPPREPQGSAVIDPGANLDREDHRRYNAALTSTLATRLRD